MYAEHANVIPDRKARLMIKGSFHIYWVECCSVGSHRRKIHFRHSVRMVFQYFFLF